MRELRVVNANIKFHEKPYNHYLVIKYVQTVVTG
jgi:hypothetical protein